MKSTKPKTDREQSLVAEEYIWDTSTDTEIHQYVEPIFNKWINPESGKVLLDLGCGNGALTARLAERGFQCTGTDFSESGIRIAQENFPKVAFFQSLIEQPLPPKYGGKYDVVIAVEVIEHLLLPRQLFARAKEALKPNGKFIITTPYHGYLKNLALALVNKYDSHWHPLRDYGHVKFFSQDTLCQLYTEQGFEITNIAKVGRLPMFARSIMIEGKLL